MYTTKERADIRQLVVNAFQCDENVAFLEKCLIRYFKSLTAHKYIHDTIDDLVANFDVEATMRYSDFIVTPSVQNMVDTLNKLFLHDRIVFIQDMIIKSRVGRCVEPNSRKYVLRDGKIKGRRPDARLMGPVHGSDLPRNDYENGQPRKQFWRYAKDTSPRVDTYNFPARLDGMRDDSAGVQTYRGAQFALVGVEGSKNIGNVHPATGCANGSDYNIGATHYNTTIHEPEWRGSGGHCVPRQHYEMLSDVRDEPVYEYGDNVPQSQSQTNEDTGQYHDSLHDGKELFDGPDNAHHLDRMFTTSIQDLNDGKAWQTTESDTMFGNDTNGQPIRYTNNYNRNDKHGSSVESERSHHSFHEKRVFRNNNKLQERAISRRYETDIGSTLGSNTEYDNKLFKHDMTSLHCRHNRDPCGPRPFNDPFEHRYKSSNPPYLELGNKPMYYPKDRPSVTIGY